MPSTIDQTQTYYDDPSTNKFYTLLWGGQDIHIGIYPSPAANDPSPPSITTASHATVIHMTQTLLSSTISLTPSTRILDLGAGYGGSARHLAKTHGCSVVCLNLSRLQNERNKELCRQEGLDDRIKVIEGSFEDIPTEAMVEGGFDVVWSQDSFLHSRNRSKVVAEIDRVLTKKPDGRVIFTDIMATEGAFDKEPELMGTMMERLHLENLATVEWYEKVFRDRGYKDLGYWVGRQHLRTHYSRLGEELVTRRKELVGEEGVEEKVLERQVSGLGKWVEAADKGFSATAWFLTLSILLICWLAEGRPVYPSQVNPYVAFISDIGAYRLKPVFVIGSIVTGTAYAGTIFAAHHVRSDARIYGIKDPPWKQAVAVLALIAGLVASVGCVGLTMFDKRRSSELHGPMLMTTFLGIAISALMTEIVYSDQMRRSSRYGELRK
ncbi:MAG: hypothetical protein Q9169_006683 [Polycauliona sp. 2 TL-2023]